MAEFTHPVDPYHNLNSAQREAVAHRSGPLRIVAGAGAGKTTTLTRSVMALVQDGLALPEQILALTFTRKAAEQLSTKMHEAMSSLGGGDREVDVDTYNAFGGRIVTQHGHVLGFPPDPVMLTESDAWITLWRVLDRIEFKTMDWSYPRGTGFGGSSGPINGITAMGNRLRDELRDPDDLAALIDIIGNEDDPDLPDILAALYVYANRKRELGAIDYGDQIVFACDLLADESVRDFYAKTYRYIVVDEFQDTNFAQRVMVRGLGACVDGNIRVVGDPNQAIYGFRGAAPDNLDSFASEDFPDTVTIELRENYRSTSRILDVANRVWDQEPGPFRGNLVSGNNVRGEPVTLLKAADLYSEAAWIHNRIAELVGPDLAYGDIAILVRKNQPKMRLYAELTALGLPVELVGNSSLYDRAEIKLIISALRVVSGSTDDISLAHLLSSDRWGLDEAALYAIGGDRQRDESLFAACRRISANPVTPTAAALGECMQSIEDLIQISYHASLSRLVDTVASLLLGVLDPVPAANLARFRAVVEDFTEGQIEHPTLAELLVYIDLLLSSSPEDEAVSERALGGKETVKMMTIHAAKGLEWPVVFISTANANDFAMSTRKSRHPLPPELVRDAGGRPVRADFADGPVGRLEYLGQLEKWTKRQDELEARRLLYVALTRAKQHLFITWSEMSPTRKKPSEVYAMVGELAPLCDCIEQPPVLPPDTTRTMDAFARRTFPAVTTMLDDVTGDPTSRIVPMALIGAEWEQVGGNQAGLDWSFTHFAARRTDIERTIDRLDTIANTVKTATRAATNRSGESITYSQIETFRACPHRYYLRYRLGLPGIPDRFAAAFGTDIHLLLQREADSRLDGNPGGIPEADRPPQPPSVQTDAWSDPGGSHDPISTYLASIDATAEPFLLRPSLSSRSDRSRFGVSSIASIACLMARSRSLITRPIAIYGPSRRFAMVCSCKFIFLPSASGRSIFRRTPTRATMFFLRWNKRQELDFDDADLAQTERRVRDFAARMDGVSPDEHTASPEICRLCDYRLTCPFSMANPTAPL